MIHGPLSKVLAEAATTIKGHEAGELTLTWSTKHGHRVVEASAATFRVESAMPEQGPGGIVHKQPPADAERRGWWAGALRATWEGIRPR